MMLCYICMYVLSVSKKVWLLVFLLLLFFFLFIFWHINGLLNVVTRGIQKLNSTKICSRIVEETWLRSVLISAVSH